MSYSKKMKTYRFENSLKQSDIAAKLGISQQVYSLIESEYQKPKFDFILLYKKVTGIDLTQDVEAVKTSDKKEQKKRKNELIRLVDLDEELTGKFVALEKKIKSLQTRISHIERRIKK